MAKAAGRHGKDTAVTNRNTKESKYAAFGQASGGSARYWSEVSAETIHEAIDALTRDGAALLFSRSNDGGALTAVLLDGDDRIRLAEREAENMEQKLASLTLTALAATGALDRL